MEPVKKNNNIGVQVNLSRMHNSLQCLIRVLNHVGGLFRNIRFGSLCNNRKNNQWGVGKLIIKGWLERKDGARESLNKFSE